MTRDDIIRMARESGLQWHLPQGREFYAEDAADALERFAALVADAEREACAELCDMSDSCDPEYIAQAIRARGSDE